MDVILKEIDEEMKGQSSLEGLLKLVQRTFNTDLAVIYLVKDDKLELIHICQKQEGAEVEDPIFQLCEEIRAQGKPLFVDDVDQANTLKAFAGIPIKSGDDVIGILAVAKQKSGKWSGEERQNLSDFAALAAEKIQLAAKPVNMASLIKAIATMAHIGGWEYDISRNRLALTRRVFRIHGLSESEDYDLQDILKLYFPKYKIGLMKACLRLMKEGKKFEKELHIVKPDQSRAWISVFGNRITSDGKTLKLHGAVQDISYRKRLVIKTRNYVEGLRMLNNIFSATDLSFDEQLDKALRVVTQFLNVSLGVISRIKDDKFYVEHVENRDSQRDLKKGDVIPLSETYCDFTYQQDRLVAISDVPHSVYANQPCYQRFRLGTYIGIPVTVDGKDYGTLNFSSSEERSTPFTEHEKGFVHLLGQWVGSIIERKQTHRALEQSLKEVSDYKRALDESANVEIIDYDGRIIYCNDKTCQVTGYSREEIIGSNFQFIHSGLHSEELFKEMWQTISKGEIWKGEIRNQKKNGSFYWIDSTVIPFLDSEGTPYQYVAINREITSRIKAQKALQASEQRFRGIFENAGMAITLVDNNGNILRFNPALQKMMGYEYEELKGANIAEFTHPADVKKGNHFYFQLMRGERENYQIEKRYIKKGGQIIWGRLTVSVVRDDDNDEPYAIGMVEDITSQKETELALRDSEKQYRDLFENAVEGIYKSTPDGRLLAVNPAMAEVMGYESPADFMDSVTHLGKQVYVRQKDREKLLEKLDKQHEIKNFETQLYRKDGSKIWVKISSRYLKNPDEKIYIEGSIEDITKRKQAEQRLKEAKEMAEEANRAKSEFLANVSHEIRTPMNAVLGFTEILSRVETDPQKQQYLDAINSSGKNLLNLINDILDLSKIEAGHLKLEYHAVNFYRLLEEINQIFSLKMQSKRLAFNVDVKPDVPQAILIDEIRMRQVLLNLVGNAIKFTEEGQITVSVECTRNVEVEDKVSLIIKVADTGIGIPKDQQGQIFKSFQQQSGQSNRKYGGTGLGLSISRRLIEKMGGALGLESKPGKGSTFIIQLPDLTIAALEEQPEEVSRKISDVLFDEARVLVVDDVPLNATLISEYLRETGLHTKEAENGQEAVDLVRKNRPAIVLMDLKMPVMDGTEAADILKSDPSTSQIPIVAVTASVLENQVDLTLFDGLLEKPVSKESLIEELKKFLSYKIKSPDHSYEEVAMAPEKEHDLEISDAMKADKDAAIARLEGPLMSEREKLKESLIIGHVQDFADHLTRFDEKFETALFSDYVDRLKRAANSFDIDSLSEYLNEYSHLVKVIKKKL